MGISELYDSCAAFHLNFLNSPLVAQELQTGGTGQRRWQI